MRRIRAASNTDNVYTGERSIETLYVAWSSTLVVQQRFNYVCAAEVSMPPIGVERKACDRLLFVEVECSA